MAEKIAYLSLTGDDGTASLDGSPFATPNAAFAACAGDLTTHPFDTYVISCIGGGDFSGSGGIYTNGYDWPSSITISTDFPCNLGNVSGNGYTGSWDSDTGSWSTEPKWGNTLIISALSPGVTLGNISSIGASALDPDGNQTIITYPVNGGSISINGIDYCGDITNGTGGGDANGFTSQNGTITISNVVSCGAITSFGGITGCCNVYQSANISIGSGVIVTGSVTTNGFAYDNSMSGNITIGNGVVISGDVSASCGVTTSTGYSGNITIGENCSSGDIYSVGAIGVAGNSRTITINSGSSVGSIYGVGYNDASGTIFPAADITIINSQYFLVDASVITTSFPYSNGSISISGNSSLSNSINGVVDISGLTASGGSSGAISLTKLLNLPFVINL